MTNSDDHAFESDDGEFIMHADGSWEALQDGRVIFSGAFSRADMHRLEEIMWPLNQSRLNLYADDRIEAH